MNVSPVMPSFGRVVALQLVRVIVLQLQVKILVRIPDSKKSDVNLCTTYLSTTYSLGLIGYLVPLT